MKVEWPVRSYWWWSEGGVVVEWWWSEGGVVVVGPPTSSTVIQRRWEGLTPGVASLESWSGLLAGSCALAYIHPGLLVVKKWAAVCYWWPRYWLVAKIGAAVWYLVINTNSVPAQHLPSISSANSTPARATATGLSSWLDTHFLINIEVAIAIIAILFTRWKIYNIQFLCAWHRNLIHFFIVIHFYYLVILSQW